MSYMEYMPGGGMLPPEDLAVAREPIGGIAADPTPPATNLQGPPTMDDQGRFVYPTARRSNRLGPPAPGRPGFDVVGTPEWTPYYEGEDAAAVMGMTTEDRTRLQQQLYALGLTDGVPLFGEVDDTTIKGVSQLMQLANRRGEDWTNTLSRLATQDAEGALRPEALEDPFAFVGRDFLPPDPVELDNDIRSLAERMFAGTDIDLSDEVVAELRGQFASLLEQQHDAQERQRFNDERAMFDAQQQAVPGGPDVTVTSEAVPEVNAEERFVAAFRERMAPKIDAVDQMRDDDENRTLIRNGLDALMGIATGR